MLPPTKAVKINKPHSFSSLALGAHRALSAAALSILTWGSASATEAAHSVSGLQPDRRPIAPKIAKVLRDDAWYARAFTGVELPYPWSLQFINEQGNWYTPFSQPGMTGRYDIRRWHKTESGD